MTWFSLTVTNCDEQDTVICDHLPYYAIQACERSKASMSLMRPMRWTVYNMMLINRSRSGKVIGTRTNKSQITICIAIFKAYRDHCFICYDLLENVQRISWYFPDACVYICQSKVFIFSWIYRVSERVYHLLLPFLMLLIFWFHTTCFIFLYKTATL